MLQLLPIELYWSILNYLEYQDLTILLSILPLKRHTKHFIKRHFPFHYSVSSLLASFESLSSLERQRHNAQFAMQALQFICDQVQDLPVTERKATFNDLLAILQQLTVERILSHDLPTDAEHDYARFSLEVRSRYLHTASIRVLHDPVSQIKVLFHMTDIICRDIEEEVPNIHLLPFCQDHLPGFGVCTVRKG